jgi:hypothetical protein
MPASHPNYTYTLDFQGPRLRCGDVKNQTMFDEMKLNNTLGVTGAYLYYNATTPRWDSNMTTDIFSWPMEVAQDVWFTTPSRNFSCETWNVTYSATFSFTNGVQNINVTNTRFDNRLVTESDGDLCPYDWCAYKGWYKAVAEMLTGEVKQAGAYGMVKTTTRIMQTALIGCPEMEPAAATLRTLAVDCPAPSLEEAVEAMSQNATLSFFGALPSV